MDQAPTPASFSAAGAGRSDPSAPTRGNTAAVMVTYHPDAELPRRLARIAPQVDRVLLVDNASNDAARGMLRSLAAGGADVELIENDQNLGVATALNQGARWADGRGYAWLLCFDQDTVAEPTMRETLGRVFAAHPRRDRIGMIGSNYRDATGKVLHVAGAPQQLWTTARTVITTGSLLSLAAYRRVGPFRDDFFIDAVDHEYGLRLRRFGYAVVLSCPVLMGHSLGQQVRYERVPGQPASTHHPALRRYYMTRNRVRLFARYWWREPRWVWAEFVKACAEQVLIGLAEKDRAAKYRAAALGLWHGLTGRMGRLDAPPWEEAP